MSFLFLTENAGIGDIHSDVTFVGDAEELGMITEELHETFHAVTTSMMLMEHKVQADPSARDENGSLSEATVTMLAEGVGEWFKKAANAVKTYWAKFVAWVKKVADRIMNFFTDAEAFLRKNREALGKLDAAALANVKFDRVKAIKDPSLLGKLTTQVSSVSESLITKGTANRANVKDPNKEVMAALKKMGKGDSISAIFQDALLKAEKDVTMTPADVKNMQAILANRKVVESQLNTVQTAAKNATSIAMSAAEQGIKTDGKGGEKETAEVAKHTIANLNKASGVVSRLISAALSVAGSVCSHAKSGLSEALTGKTASKDDKKAKQEDGSASVLDQFGFSL